MDELKQALKEMLDLYLPDENYEEALKSPKVPNSMKWAPLRTPTAGDVRRWVSVYQNEPLAIRE